MEQALKRLVHFECYAIPHIRFFGKILTEHRNWKVLQVRPLYVYYAKLAVMEW